MSDNGLHSVPSGTAWLWCGPTAIAALTGISGAAIESAILAHRTVNKPQRGNRKLHGARVKTTWANEIVPVLAALGFAATEHLASGSLAGYLRRNRSNKPRLVLITGHYIAVCGDHCVDSMRREPTPINRSPYMRRRVQRVWQIGA
jgi:hypothetical protein